MPDLKQLKDRIRGVKSTQKITQAMHLVSAVKLKKIKDKVGEIGLYFKILNSIMHDASRDNDLISNSSQNNLFFGREQQHLPCLFVVITSERGLCGGLNSNIIRMVREDIQNLHNQGQQVKLLLIGKRGRDGLYGHFQQFVEQYYSNLDINAEYITRCVRDKIIRMIFDGEIGACNLYYNEFKNAMTQIARKQAVLPIDEVSQSKEVSDMTVNVMPHYEYEGTDIINHIINLYIASNIHCGLLQNRASEEGARMTAMNNATQNADELIDKLTLQLNRSRQAVITMELAEIISGAEAL